MAVTYANVRVWGSGLRPRATASAAPALPPSAYNKTRLTGTNRASWPAPRPLRGAEFRSSSFAGAPIARGSSARAPPPDAYNAGRLTGQNRREAPTPHPRTARTRAALMSEGDAAAGDGPELAGNRAGKMPPQDPSSSFDINEIVAGLKAAAESAETDEEKDVLTEQLATLRPFVLISKRRPLSEEEQGIVDEVGRALLAQAEGAAGEEVAADAAQRVAFDRDQKAISDARQVLGELEFQRNALTEVAANRAQELADFVADARTTVPLIQKEAAKLAADAKAARADRRSAEKRLANIPAEIAAAESAGDRVAADSLVEEEKRLEETRENADQFATGAAARIREITDMERDYATGGPIIEAAARAAGRAAVAAEDAFARAPLPAATVPRKRRRVVPEREEVARRKQVEALSEAIEPLSVDIQRALFDIAAAAPGASPLSAPRFTAKEVMSPANERKVLRDVLKDVVRAANGGILGTNSRGNTPNKEELFKLVRAQGLQQSLADAVNAYYAGRP